MIKGSISQLQQRQKEITDSMQTLTNFGLGEEARDLTTVEDAQFTALEVEFDKNDKNIKRQQSTKRRAGVAYIQNVNRQGEQGEQGAIQKRFSITKAISAIALPQSRKLEGIELEMHQEATEETRGFGKVIEGIGIPSFLMTKRGMQERAMTVGTAANGGNTVATDLGDMINFLQPRLQVEALGATMISGLSSNLDLPTNDGISAAAWEGETDDNAETAPTFSKKSLTPHRLGAFTDFSKQLLMQSNISIDNLVTRQLESAIRIKLDSTMINGSGSGAIPEGILNMTGIGSVAMGTNGAAPTRAKLIDLISAIAAENADMGKLAFLTTPGIRGKLQQTLVDAGSGLFVWASPEELLGYRALVSTQVPSNLTKGSSSLGNAIIYGNWEELFVAQWGGLDLVVDPYTKAISSEVRIVANSFWDFAALHVKSFAAIQDALTA